LSNDTCGGPGVWGVRAGAAGVSESAVRCKAPVPHGWRRPLQAWILGGGTRGGLKK
jgi:hypothetical protein